MKLNRWFVVGILVFLVVMFIVELQLPKNFSWNPTFRHADKQPFGCYLFDDLMSATMPKGYSVTDSSLFQLAQDSMVRRGVLVVADRLNLIPAEMNAVLRMARNGSHVMLVAHGLGMFAEDTLGVDVRGASESFDLQNFVKFNKERETMKWKSRTLGYQPRNYAVFHPLVTSHLRVEKNTKHGTIGKPIDQQAFNKDDYPLVVTFRHGKGFITFASVPLLFTNYAVVDEDEQHRKTIGFTLRCLSPLKQLPVVRTEAYCPAAEEETEQTPLRYIISQPPLRWALYTLMIGALLFLVFEGRRRQRVIPIEKAPENHSLEFINLVGSLYYHSKERRSLVVRKWTYFAEELRRTVHVDVTDDTEDDITLPTLARLTAIDEQEIRTLIQRLRLLAAADEETEISRKEMKKYIDQMNWIIKKL